MKQILASIIDFFRAEPGVYAHRHRTIEAIALEKDMDINSIKNDTKAIMDNEGRTEAILKLRKQFHIPLSAAWIFVDKLDRD